ncbi:DsbA family protein [Nocardioides halotolerans]|jgi:protein-disulfide isomerase|uniref:DsbA family protein n=1 Tax=Nocardioides halotolerans TaxID=433660 RepID=UPI0004192450|nr:thioredoxin domain-containing protein [Nocardioides halotolerans]
MSTHTRARTQAQRQVRQAEEARRARKRRIATAVGALVIVGLVVAIVVVVVQAAGKERTLPEVTGAVVAPANLTATGAVPVGDGAAPVTLEIYYDYMCPACGAFEAANGEELDRLVANGTARIELRPIAFLDEQSRGTEYSTRSAAAFAVVADAAPDRAWAFHTALYAQQPAEGSEGLTDDQIAAIATGAGVPAEAVDRLSDGTYRPWVASVTREAFDSGVQGTPTVKIDGAVFGGNVYQVGPLTEAIEAAAAS